MIRVLIADDQERVRSGFRMVLDATDGIEVVAEAADGREAVTKALHLRPDVCLFDIQMPEMDGLTATELVAGPDVDSPLKVVVATTFDLDEYVHRALRAGAAGFLLKDAGPDWLVQAVRSAAAGDALISPAVTGRLLAHLVLPGSQPADESPLTERETEVVMAVARGLSNAEVAAELFVSLGTVKAHLAAAMTKLRARNRVEVVIWAYERGIVG